MHLHDTKLILQHVLLIVLEMEDSGLQVNGQYPWKELIYSIPVDLFP
jgi:hypothetical protein